MYNTFNYFRATDEIYRVQDESCDLSKDTTTSSSDTLGESSSFSTISLTIQQATQEKAYQRMTDSSCLLTYTW